MTDRPVPALPPSAAEAATPSPPASLDALYDNRARVPTFARHLEGWRAASAEVRARTAGRARLGVAYGPHPTETLDVFPSDRSGGEPSPLLVFIHGGYWRSLSKDDFSFVAPPFQAAGATVVVPDYALCPAVGIDTIALQMARMLAWVIEHAGSLGGDPQRVVVAGHSAGGHLAAMLMACDGRRLTGARGPARRADLCREAISLSGLFDLEPLVDVGFLQAYLRLDRALARRLSPIRWPAPRGRLRAWVGGDESPAFIEQNEAIGRRWGPRRVPVCESVPGRHHFDIVDAWIDPAQRLYAPTLEALGLRH